MGRDWIAPLLGHVDALTEAWLGYSLPPVKRLIAQSGWTADDRPAYCARCGGSVGPGEATASGCSECRGSSAIGEGVVRLGAYESPLREWVLAVKFERWSEMGRELGRRLGAAAAAARLVDTDRVIVVPMPMPVARRLYRGIDHTRVIADGAASALGAPLVRVLHRSHGPPQITLSATERRRVGARTLRVRRPVGRWRLDGLHVLLVDDVRTTGGSLRAAVRALRPRRPARIQVAVVCVADDRSRRAARPPSGAPAKALQPPADSCDQGFRPLGMP